MRKEEENDHPVLGLHCAQEKFLQLPITKCTQWNNCTVCTDNFWKKSSPFIDFQGHCRNLSLSYSYSEIILGLRGSSSGTNVYRGVVRTCQLYWRVTDCVCVPLGWFGKNVCVFITERERERGEKGEREGGIKRRERRAVIPLWPWLRFHWACGVSWPCLDFAQEHRPAQTSYTPHLRTDVQ